MDVCDCLGPWVKSVGICVWPMGEGDLEMDGCECFGPG